MIPNNEKIKRLASALMWWLNYTSSVGREYLLNESAIKFPVSEYLESSLPKSVELEFSHPKLARKRLDLLLKERKKKKSYFEFKYIKNGTTKTEDGKQRVFNDLMRLHLACDAYSSGYFLICGNYLNFNNDFQKTEAPKNDSIGKGFNEKDHQVSEPNGLYTEWFSFDIEDPTKKIELNNNSLSKPFYDLFYEENKNSYLSKTNKKLKKLSQFKTELVFLSENINQEKGAYPTFKIGIWEIKNA